jgi:predicted transcriptional regulator
MDRAMADAGSGERRFPDGRVLRLCSGEAGSTISAIGREVGITRQGASKVVTDLRDRGYVTVADSTTSKREKSVTVTSRGIDYLADQSAAARTIEDELRADSVRLRCRLRWGRCSTRWTRGRGCASAATFVVRPESSRARISPLVGRTSADEPCRFWDKHVEGLRGWFGAD